jgi:hypothetical protein
MQEVEDQQEICQEVDQWIYSYNQDIVVKLQDHLPLDQIYGPL